MRKTYRYDNALVHVSSLDTYDRERLKTATEEFLKKVVKEQRKNGNSNTRTNL